eukprot:NODE_4617_length_784_cov_2.752381_g3837_i0.p3 GENE.NODE_4617_length_784_cov_2.752381_g3837_i0~~NODE_4617_length_784_cov_2.752381_g3837_i0.p3  ORF type:complete len:56 (-),score=0.07 NODE_4617_length_784_cov_2.752381_g3837_i0:127-294(-)
MDQFAGPGVAPCPPVRAWGYPRALGESQTGPFCAKKGQAQSAKSGLGRLAHTFVH